MSESSQESQEIRCAKLPQNLGKNKALVHMRDKPQQTSALEFVYRVPGSIISGG